ncbi:PEP-CTERM sorting domain-containing protein [Kiritimatiellota bacterium B12222]|nr:PEP-CTERM sorting domain-containing protein [Kiritimatiellota bacterium B12222]
MTLNGIEYTTSELTQVTLTAWKGASQGQLLQYNGGPTNPDATTRRGFLETDWSGNTGLINPSTTAGSVGLSFNTSVKNIAGADLFLYEISSGTPDAFQVTINGFTQTVNGSDYGNSGVSSASSDVLNLSSTPASLGDLLGLSSTRSSDNITQNIHGVGIDFSDFGVALGDTVTSFTMNSNGSNTFDPVIIAAIPEASSLWLLSLGALTGILIKRRRP